MRGQPDRPPISEASPDRLCAALDGQPTYRADQLRQALFRTSATGFDQMLTLPAETRAALDQQFRFESLRLLRAQRSTDGTRKALFHTWDGAAVETVRMPTERPGAATVCLSSQAGCGMGCTFCATGALGLTRNLTAAEILDQFLYVRRRASRPAAVDRAVFMGMGEPLANLPALETAAARLAGAAYVGLSARRVTVSTVGLPAGIDAMASWGLPLGLAVSLHAPDDGLRATLAPIARRFPLPALMEASRRYQQAVRRRVTYEYTMLAGVNDARAQAVDLARLLRGQRCHVNLIPFNTYPGAIFRASARPRIRAFRDELRQRGVPVTIRRTRGRDISGACGQLHAGMLAAGAGTRRSNGAAGGRAARPAAGARP